MTCFSRVHTRPIWSRNRSSAGPAIYAPGEDGDLQKLHRSIYGHKQTESSSRTAASQRLGHRIFTPVASAGCLGVPTSAPPLSGAASIAMAMGNRTVYDLR